MAIGHGRGDTEKRATLQCWTLRAQAPKTMPPSPLWQSASVIGVGLLRVGARKHDRGGGS
jgi:hypothetical protein